MGEGVIEQERIAGGSSPGNDSMCCIQALKISLSSPKAWLCAAATGTRDGSGSHGGTGKRAEPTHWPLGWCSRGSQGQ